LSRFVPALVGAGEDQARQRQWAAGAAPAIEHPWLTEFLGVNLQGGAELGVGEEAVRGHVRVTRPRQVALELRRGRLLTGALGHLQAGNLPRQGGDLLALLFGAGQRRPADPTGCQDGLAQGDGRAGVVAGGPLLVVDAANDQYSAGSGWP